MSWEQRGNRRYYFRKRRQAGRVVSEYVGAGELAVAAATLAPGSGNGVRPNASTGNPFVPWTLR